VDRDSIARAQRRRQAHEALEFERNRATSLEEQVEEIVAEIDGPRIDEEAFASMEPEDAEAARAVLRLDDAQEPEEEWLGLENESFEADPSEPEPEPEDTEGEIVRLQEEIAASRRRQEVLERYLEALDQRPGSPAKAAGDGD
jgi:hypothetical protein